MKRHLNTLYVTTQGAYLAKDGETVLVRIDGESKLRVPVHNLEGIVCFGNVSVSPFLLGHCSQAGVHISFLTKNGRFLARVQGPTTGNVLLRREQYRRADGSESSAMIARPIVLAKLANSRVVLQRALRDHKDRDGCAELITATAELAKLIKKVQSTADLDSIRGLEGAGARVYFGIFDHLIVQQKDDFGFSGRSRRPPMDPINALISFLYTLLVHDVGGALEGVGLDPAVGFLHRDRPGRPSLALDLMEELRSFVADRVAISLVNLRRTQARHFTVRESGAVYLTDVGRKRVIEAYQKRKADELTHPFLKKKTTVGMLPHLQALLLSRYLRNDLDGYPPFLAK